MGKTKQDLIKEFPSPEDWKSFFSLEGNISQQCKQRGYPYTTVVRYFSQSSSFCEFRGKEYAEVPRCRSFKEFRQIYKSPSQWREFFHLYLSDGVSITKCCQLQGYSAKSVIEFFSKDYEFKSLHDGKRTGRSDAVRKSISILEKEFSPEDWRIFYKDFLEGNKTMAQCISEHGYSPITCTRYFSKSKSYIEFINSSQYKKPGYFVALKKCKKLNLIPHFTIDDYRDAFNLYEVECGVCNTVYKTSFRNYNPVLCPTCKKSTFRSVREIQVSNFLDELGIEHYSNYHPRFSMDNHTFEIDCFIPSLNIGFEFNGMFYHTSDNTDWGKVRSYHKKKTIACLNNGIKLYHIWEDVSDDLCLSIIESKLGISKRIYARNLKVIRLSTGDGQEFFDLNHADKSNNSASVYYGLVDSANKVYCCLSLLRRCMQSSKRSYWEIGRFANLAHYTVVGGYSRLLKYAIEYLKSFGEHSLVSYCNRDLSPDAMDTFYYKNGFELIGDSGLIYWYYTDRKIQLNYKLYKQGKITRQACQKQKLLNHYKLNNLEIPKDASEHSLASGLGLKVCYNSGNWKFIKYF